MGWVWTDGYGNLCKGSRPNLKSHKAMDIFGTGGGEGGFWGDFPHYKGDSNTTKLTTQRQI